MKKNSIVSQDYIFNIERRSKLVQSIKKQFNVDQGMVLLFAGFEDDKHAFLQESSFYYLTGLNEPAVALAIDLSSKTTLYIPNCLSTRAQWMHSAIELTQENAVKLGLDAIDVLGAQCYGYQLHPFFDRAEYEKLISIIQAKIASGQKIFTLCPDNAHEYVQQRLVLSRLQNFVPELTPALVDISGLVAQQRRIKNMREIELMYRAAEITMLAQEAAANAIAPKVLECEVQASLEYIFTASTGRASFPSIVAGGKNSTVLHYTINNQTLNNGDLVVVDIGAEFEHYCADLTRTYPVSGKFTPRQLEIYNLVLETQEYIASLAKPGMYLNNKEMPEKSLNHLARAFLAQKGYDKYFIHGIGHYLGLDVHDVGTYKTPLEEGDVITIEPGIYIPDEKIGVRIEDDYWVVQDGVVCLSEQLPKKPEEVQAFMRSKEEVSNTDDEQDDIDFAGFDFDQAN